MSKQCRKKQQKEDLFEVAAKAFSLTEDKAGLSKYIEKIIENQSKSSRKIDFIVVVFYMLTFSLFLVKGELVKIEHIDWITFKSPDVFYMLSTIFLLFVVVYIIFLSYYIDNLNNIIAAYHQVINRNIFSEKLHVYLSP